MAINAAHWTITRSTKVVDYIGGDHGTATATYATAIEFHRWMQGLADEATSTGDDELDITDILPTSRATDNFITMIGGYNITDAAAEHLYDGSIVNADGTIYDGVVNFGNIGVVIQIQQDGAVLADDFWNWSIGGAADGVSATVMTDAGALWTEGTDELIGYVIKNVTDGSSGVITANDATTITVAELTGGTADAWAASDAYLVSKGLNSNATSGISHQFMIEVTTTGTDIDNRKLRGTNRTYLKTYGEFTINQTSRGNNVLALSDALDLNNTTAASTVAGWVDIYPNRTDSTTTVSGVNSVGQKVLNVVSGAVFAVGDFLMTGVATDATVYQIDSIATNALTLHQNLEVATVGGETVYDLDMGFIQVDVDDIGGAEDYYTHWDKNAKTINQFTEYQKYLTRDGSLLNIYGMNPELFRGITHELDIDGGAGTSAPQEDISWGTGATAGTGQLLAIDNVTAASATKIWFQLTSGVTPADNLTITGGVSGATYVSDLTTGSIVDRSSLVQTPYFGVTTGSAIIGSYGFTLTKNDLASTDLVFDLTNTKVTPPNTVTFSVNGAATSDYLHVAEWDGTSTDADGNPEVNYNQMGLGVILDADNETVVEVGGTGDNATIPADTPATGFIRVEDDAGRWRKLAYTGYTTTQFTGVTGSPAGQEDFLGDAAAVNSRVYVAYIDQISDADPQQFSYVYDAADRKFVIKGRWGGASPIKESIGTGTMSNTGGSANIARIADE